MKILFTLLSLPENSINNEHDMYIDLAKQCVALGHEVTIVGSSARSTRISSEAGMKVVRIKKNRIVGEPNLIKKGVAMALLPYYYKYTFYRYIKEYSFDWIVMPTPPITLIDFVVGLKRKSQAKLYLVLRDIHHKSSWSLGEIHYKWMYKYLDRRSKKGYEAANIIGCMSQKNISFILREYPSLDSSKMRILYNWMQPAKEFVVSDDVRKKYNLEDKIIALFGGNIALGQRIENIVDLAYHYKDNQHVKFVVVGKGVKKDDLRRMVEDLKLDNVLFLEYMPQQDYLNFIRNVDIGLISIHEENAAPTCPSKLASYMSLRIPVLAMINRNNDYGQFIDDAKAGYWAVGSDKQKIYESFDTLMNSPALRERMGENGLKYFLKYMTTEVAAATMIAQMESLK